VEKNKFFFCFSSHHIGIEKDSKKKSDKKSFLLSKNSAFFHMVEYFKVGGFVSLVN
jgi:hypothetical protein